MAEDNMIFAGIFQIYFLRLGIFFGCLGIFSNLFRAEVLERTLHYYFMSPVRREVLAVSKYIAGLVASSVYFGGSVVLRRLIHQRPRLPIGHVDSGVWTHHHRHQLLLRIHPEERAVTPDQ
jgi:hypothetical protein